MDFVNLLKEATKKLASRLEEASIEWIKQNGDIAHGGIIYYVGTNRSHHCRNPKEALEKLLTATGGDVDAIAECLSASAWKPATTKKAIGEEAFTQLFETRTTLDIKTGKPKLGVKKMDTKYINKESEDAQE